MTTQHDERAEFIRELEIIASTQWSGFFPGSAAERMKGIVQQAAALLAADAQAGGELVAWRCSAPPCKCDQSNYSRCAFANFNHPQPQAVARGWKDRDTAKLVNDLRDVAVQFHAAEQLRERIAHIIRPLADLLSASPAAPAAAQVADWRDGVNVARLRAALTRMGVATEPSEEGMAADLENWVNTLTRAVTAGKPAAQVAQPLTEIGENHGLDTDERVCFYEQDFYVLSNFSSFRVNWRGIDFDTSEHAYHCEKFFSTVVGIAHEIQGAKSAHEAFKIAERERNYRRPDWDEVKVDIMRDILRAKADQHEYVRRKLLATGDRELVENSWRDDYWGWGPNRDGKNMLGKLWMEVRAELRSHGIGKDQAS